jgi:hypothetical protein
LEGQKLKKNGGNRVVSFAAPTFQGLRNVKDAAGRFLKKPGKGYLPGFKK